MVCAFEFPCCLLFAPENGRNRFIRNVVHQVLCLEHSRSLEAVVAQPFQNFLAFYGTCRFIVDVTAACNISHSWAELLQSIPFHLIFVKISFNIMLAAPWFCSWSPSLLLYVYHVTYPHDCPWFHHPDFIC